jgi:hypothetical protein
MDKQQRIKVGQASLSCAELGLQAGMSRYGDSACFSAGVSHSAAAAEVPQSLAVQILFSLRAAFLNLLPLNSGSCAQ